MATKTQGRLCLWQLCQLLLFSAGVMSLDCNLLHHQQSKFNRYSLQLLQKTGRSFPLECLGDLTAFQFPEKVLKHKFPQHAQMAAHEILQQLFGIFSRNLLQTRWEKGDVELFRNGLHLQTKHLEKCLSTKGGRPILRLKRYFQRIKDFLEKKKYSTCAWETVRLEAQRCFLYMDKLTVMMKN
ncbi:interferon kappa-like [Pelodiscus sinensis]|uniref:Interferon kappa-like n=1 Tax=Pelodiscus sinensis TaxID=13735 RepID=K7EZP5_PELSI|nr:interferon kappa-like [Pelodiscus sinensis]UYF04967.1 type I interferon 7 [Pelodiscus sinensis]|eukprot:XP_006123052.1 interferon kappa-like [Pelodiscus sinensis]